MLNRPNLTYVTDTIIQRLVFSDNTVIGVEMNTSQDPQIYSCWAKGEVIVCAGTVGTPQLLMLSGVGPKEDLEKLGISVVKDMPAVGRHVVDVRRQFLLFPSPRPDVNAYAARHLMHIVARFIRPYSIPHGAGTDVRLPKQLFLGCARFFAMAAVWDRSSLLNGLLVDGVRQIHRPPVRLSSLLSFVLCTRPSYLP